MVIYPSHDSHAPIDFRGAWLIDESASNIAQKFANFGLPEILNPGIQAPTVVPRDAGGLFDQTSHHIAAFFGVDCRGAYTNPVPEWPIGAIGSPMRPHFARWSPNHEDMTAFYSLQRKNWWIRRIESIASTSNPLLSLLKLLRGQASRRQNGATVFFCNPNDDVTAIKVVVVVRKCANCLQDLISGRIGIPRRLELDSLRLHASAMKQVVKIDR